MSWTKEEWLEKIATSAQFAEHVYEELNSLTSYIKKFDDQELKDKVASAKQSYEKTV